MNEYIQASIDLIGKGAFFMLGATNRAYDIKDNSIIFKIKVSTKVTHIKLIYTSDDLYTIIFYKIRGTQPIKIVSEHKGLYNDMVHKSIEQNTGLYTKLF